MAEKKKYIEHKKIPQAWGWALIIFTSAALISFGMWVHLIVPDIPRVWDFGQFPDVPAESVYSTIVEVEAPKKVRVIAPLPGAQPLDSKLPPVDWAEAAKRHWPRNPQETDL